MKKWSVFFVIIVLLSSAEMFSQINGRNVKIVNYNNGSFKQTGNGVWTEYATQNRQFKFRETMRDDWSVYLIDDTRDITVQMDLFKKEIYIYWDRPERAKMYDITRVSKGQPIVRKQSSVAAGPKGYKKGPNENGTRFFKTMVDVAYGANGKYVFKKNVIGSITFNNATFGDPAPGFSKSGYFKPSTPDRTTGHKSSGPTGYTKIADENGSHYFNNYVDVAYGANGKFVYQSNVSGQISFNNAVFGDPSPGTSKAGYYKNSTTPSRKESTTIVNTRKNLPVEQGKAPPINNTKKNPVTNTDIPTIEKNPIAPSDMALIMEWIASEVADSKIEYCYKQSYGRGVGQTLTRCPPGTEKNGLLCYPKCRQGFSGGGPVCWQNCPKGFRNDPAHCGKPEPYGRGTGYALHFGELSLDGAMKRCRSENAQGCEQHLLLIYPKCKTGFHPVACCVCSPDCPAGMTDIGVSCEKGSYGRGVGSPMICANGLEQNGALCYAPCKSGYAGNGPVCWRKCPPNQPVDCGAGCAKSTADCVEKTMNQVMAVAEFAANIASMGTTSGFTAAKAGVKTSIKAGNKIAAKMYMKQAVKELAQGFQQLTTKKVVRKLNEKFKRESVEWVKNEYAAVQMKIMMQEEFSAEDLRDLAGLDPTGAAQVIEAFWQPVCADPNPFPNLSKNYQ